MLTVRHIQTTKDAKGVATPVLDEKHQEIVLWSVEIPSEIEAEGGKAIDAYVAEQLAKRAESTNTAIPESTEES